MFHIFHQLYHFWPKCGSYLLRDTSNGRIFVRCYLLLKQFHVLLSLRQIDGEALLQKIGSRLEHLRDVLEIRHHGGPALLLKVLIVDQPLTDPGLLPRQSAALLRQLGTGDEGLVRGRHRQRRVDLALKIDICNAKDDRSYRVLNNGIFVENARAVPLLFIKIPIEPWTVKLILSKTPNGLFSSLFF